MGEAYCAIMTQSHVYLVVPVTWLKNKQDKLTQVYYSPNRNDLPDFEIPVLYFVDKTKRAVYNAYIIRFLSKFHFAYFPSLE